MKGILENLSNGNSPQTNKVSFSIEIDFTEESALAGYGYKG